MSDHTKEKLEAMNRISELTRQRDKLLAACTIVQDRLGIICADGGSMQDFLNAGSLTEIIEAKSAIAGE